MNKVLCLFLFIQFVLIYFMALKAFRHHSRQLIMSSIYRNTLPVLWAFHLTRSHYPGPYPGWIKVSFVIIYTMLTIGTLRAWWIPYIFGSSQKHKDGFTEYKDTHTFLPARGDNVVPNTLHVMLHVQVWFCCAVSWYLLLRDFI